METSAGNGGWCGDARAPKWAKELMGLLRKVLWREKGGGFPDRRGGFWRQPVVCWYCRRRGHMAKRCPDASENWREGREDRRCWTCKQPGHLARECTEAVNDGEDTHEPWEEGHGEVVLVGAAVAVAPDGGGEKMDGEPSQPNCAAHHVVEVQGPEQPEAAHEVSGGEDEVPGKLNTPPPGGGGWVIWMEEEAGTEEAVGGVTEAAQVQRHLLDERVSSLIQSMQPILWEGIATKMLLELRDKELLHLVNTPELMRSKVEESVAVIQAYQATKVAVPKSLPPGGGGREDNVELRSLPPGGEEREEEPKEKRKRKKKKKRAEERVDVDPVVEGHRRLAEEVKHYRELWGFMDKKLL